jgi:hypothetical protein
LPNFDSLYVEKIQECKELLLETLILLSFRYDPFPFSAKYISSRKGSKTTVEIISLSSSTEIEIAKYGTPCEKFSLPLNISTIQ